jgi:hypothetical protein
MAGVVAGGGPFEMAMALGVLVVPGHRLIGQADEHHPPVGPGDGSW